MATRLKDQRLKKLKEKYGRGYVVYGLHDPRTAMCRYIGQTMSVVDRARTHCDGMSGGSAVLHGWFADLRASGLRPTFAILGTAAEEEHARVLELYETGMHYMRGHDLLNGRLDLIVKKFRVMVSSYRFRGGRYEFGNDHITPWTLSEEIGISVHDAKRWMRQNQYCKRVGQYGSPLWLGMRYHIEEDISELSKRQEASAA